MILELMMMMDLLTSIYDQEQQCCQQAKLVASDGGSGGYLVGLYLSQVIMHLLELFSMVLQGQLTFNYDQEQQHAVNKQNLLINGDYFDWII